MPRTRSADRVSPTEIESREDSLAEGEDLADYSTLDRGLKSIASTLRIVIIVGIAMFVAFIAVAVLYVQHEEQREWDSIEERNRLVAGVCATIEDVAHTSTQALISAATLDGNPPSDAVIAAYVDPIEESIERCVDQIPTIE